MSEENLEIVRGIYCRPLSLDPDLLAGLAEARHTRHGFRFHGRLPRWTRSEGSRLGPSDRSELAVGRPALRAGALPRGRWASGFLCSCGLPRRGSEVGFRSSATLPTSARSAAGGWCDSRRTPTAREPSKPPDCGSRRPNQGWRTFLPSLDRLLGWGLPVGAQNGPHSISEEETTMGKTRRRVATAATIAALGGLGAVALESNPGVHGASQVTALASHSGKPIVTASSGSTASLPAGGAGSQGPANPASDRHPDERRLR